MSEASRGSNGLRASFAWARAAPLLPLGSRGELETFDGTVIALSERDGLRTFLVRFTGVSWERQDAIDALARGSQPLSDPASH